MKNTTLLKRQKGKFLFYNMIAFAVIFLILGIVAITAIDGFFYRSADTELERAEKLLTEYIYGTTDIPQVVELVKNPRTGFIIYRADKSVIMYDMPFGIDCEGIDAPDGTEKTYNKIINDFHYRVSEFSLDYRNTQLHVQVLINIDGEVTLRNNIVAIYLICLGAIVILTTFASLIMSSVTLKPVKKALEDQTRFVSDASHELRTPLTTLQCRLEQLLREPDEKIIDKSGEISDCLSEVLRITKLSNSLLTLAKSDADKMLPDITEFDMLELINKVAAPYAEIARYDGKKFNITGNSVPVKADQAKIMQVLVILLDNALKYTNASDEINIELRKTKNKCEIIVADTGIGISEKGLHRIFERFYRDDTSRGATEGSGLGLAIAKQIIEEEHGGTISASRALPHGTIFTVTLP